MSKSKRIKELKNQIHMLEKHMEVCAYGKSELLELTSMQEELAKLEGE